jgi:DNA recombination protein RmuC
MEIFTQILFLISGLFIGFLAGWMFLKRKSDQSSVIESLKSKLNDQMVETKIKAGELEIKSREADELKMYLEKNRAKVVELSSELSTAKANLENMSDKLENQKKELESIREKFVFEFKTLASEIMQKESKTFTEQNKSQLENLLKPLGVKIQEFEKKVEETYEKETREQISLKEEVKRLSELNKQISTDAQNLAEALKGQSKTQGNWGELILESILEKSGLAKDREFFVQKGFKSEDGRRLQPDVVLNLPGNKNVIIDSKVSLTAYEKYSSEEDENLRQLALKNHLLSVKKHVDELAVKNYQHIYDLNSLDFVIMFLPVEPAFLAAVKEDQGLWGYAYEKGVLLIGPTNLFATLKMVSSLWQQEYQNRNVMDIALESGRLYDKFVGFVKDMTDIGDKISAAQKSYDQALGKLSEGKGNLVTRAEKIKALGAKTSKALPENLINRDLDDDNSANETRRIK